MSRIKHSQPAQFRDQVVLEDVVPFMLDFVS
jgi:hypothetical protein